MAERSDTEESLDMAQCKRLQDAFFLRQPSHMASLAQSQNQSCKTITMLGEMCGQLELEWLHCHSENWASQMARRDPDRNSTAGRWTLPPSTFAGLTRLPSTRVTSGCWSTFVLCALYLSVSLMTLFLPSGKTTCVSLIKVLCTPTTPPVVSSPVLQHALKNLGYHQAQVTHFSFASVTYIALNLCYFSHRLLLQASPGLCFHCEKILLESSAPNTLSSTAGLHRLPFHVPGTPALADWDRAKASFAFLLHGTWGSAGRWRYRLLWGRVTLCSCWVL